MEQEISMSNTKKEIIAAYEELLEQIKNQKNESPKLQKQEAEKSEIVVNASANTHEAIINNIAALKLNLSKYLDKIGGDLGEEFNKLSGIQKAIKIEEESLKNTYELSAETDSLAAILQVQKEKKEIFDSEISEKRNDFENSMSEKRTLLETEINSVKENWKAKKEKYESALTEEKSETEKLRKREEDEYAYNLKIIRKKEVYIYEEKKAKQEKDLAEKQTAFEKEIKEREQAVAENETELRELRKKTDLFPKELEKAIAETVEKITDKLNTEFEFKIQLTQKETEGELKLKGQIITDLQAKIEGLDNQISGLSNKADKAEANAKDIVMKAIETSGNKQFVIERSSKKEEKE